MNLDVEPTFFATPTDFRKWLESNHDSKSELIVGFYKVASGKPSMTWSQSVDQALCFGWIDGIRKSIDQESYFIRFTPRKPGSIWSNVNIKKVDELTANGLIQPAGIQAFERRQAHKSGIYSFEKEEVKFSEEFEKQFMENDPAWEWFIKMPISYRKPATHWVMSAKQYATQLSRLAELIRDSSEKRKVKSLRY